MLQALVSPPAMPSPPADDELLDSIGPLDGTRVLVIGHGALETVCGLIRRGCTAAELQTGSRVAPEAELGGSGGRAAGCDARGGAGGHCGRRARADHGRADRGAETSGGLRQPVVALLRLHGFCAIEARPTTEGDVGNGGAADLRTAASGVIMPRTSRRPGEAPLWLTGLILAVVLWLAVRIVGNVTEALTGMAPATRRPPCGSRGAADAASACGGGRRKPTRPVPSNASDAGSGTDDARVPTNPSGSSCKPSSPTIVPRLLIPLTDVSEQFRPAALGPTIEVSEPPSNTLPLNPPPL